MSRWLERALAAVQCAPIVPNVPKDAPSPSFGTFGTYGKQLQKTYPASAHDNRYAATEQFENRAALKLAFLDLLRPGQCGWTTEQWRAYFDKRCEIAASDGSQSRAQAETLALACCVIEWLNQHLVPSAPGYCAWCGKPESAGAVVLPFGTEPGTHTWLHAECWPDWHRARRADAIAALGAMGIRA